MESAGRRVVTSLTIYADGSPFGIHSKLSDFSDIATALSPTGVKLERWEAGADVPATVGDEDILAAYAGDIDWLKVRGGYQSHDVVRLTPDHPARFELRRKFLEEHVHDDDEVRFFVEGSGLFYIHHGGVVHALECTAGDLIVVPAGTRHWFDTGEHPFFTAMRLFTTPDGWVARYTGDLIAQDIPLYAGALPA
jgi:1,2-dihydroxy-3-keto-5-methylthiopentene dioxygenase